MWVAWVACAFSSDCSSLNAQEPPWAHDPSKRWIQQQHPRSFPSGCSFWIKVKWWFDSLVRTPALRMKEIELWLSSSPSEIDQHWKLFGAPPKKMPSSSEFWPYGVPSHGAFLKLGATKKVKSSIQLIHLRLGYFTSKKHHPAIGVSQYHHDDGNPHVFHIHWRCLDRPPRSPSPLMPGSLSRCDAEAPLLGGVGSHLVSRALKWFEAC